MDFWKESIEIMHNYDQCEAQSKTYSASLHDFFYLETLVVAFEWDLFEFLFSFHAGLDRIEFLQMHPNVDIYRRAYDIIDRFFGPATEEADSTVAPVVAPNQFEFHPPAVDLNGGAGAPFNFWT